MISRVHQNSGWKISCWFGISLKTQIWSTEMIVLGCAGLCVTNGCAGGFKVLEAWYLYMFLPFASFAPALTA